jgi:hypothetical protein
MKLLVQPEYQLNRYDFQESYTVTPEEDQSSLLQKKAFQFKYRLAADPLETFQRRNNRMVDRHLTRYEQKGIQNVIKLFVLFYFSCWKDWQRRCGREIVRNSRFWRNSGRNFRLMRV